MYYSVENDLVTGAISSDSDVDKSEFIESELNTIQLDKLRYDGKSIVDVSSWTNYRWFIDQFGIKHVDQHDKSWQPLVCDFTDELYRDPSTKTWKVKSSEYKLKETVESSLASIYRVASKVITRAYEKHGGYQLFQLKVTECHDLDNAVIIPNEAQVRDVTVESVIEETLSAHQSVIQFISEVNAVCAEYKVKILAATSVDEANQLVTQCNDILYSKYPDGR